MANLELVQKMRTQTGAGIMDIKQALEEANGDENQALEILRKKGRKIAAKKQAERTAKDGIVEAYIHAGGKIGSMVLLACETDFVAKNLKANGIEVRFYFMSEDFTRDTAQVPIIASQVIEEYDRSLVEAQQIAAAQEPGEILAAARKKISVGDNDRYVSASSLEALEKLLAKSKPETRQYNGRDYNVVLYNAGDEIGRLLKVMGAADAYHLPGGIVLLEKGLSPSEAEIALEHEALEMKWEKELQRELNSVRCRLEEIEKRE